MVINKSMISNLLNYPNPFTTSTAFVFTLTGSQVPQNMRIQILTMTGKIVREITSRNSGRYMWEGILPNSNGMERISTGRNSPMVYTCTGLSLT